MPRRQQLAIKVGSAEQVSYVIYTLVVSGYIQREKCGERVNFVRVFNFIEKE